MVYAHRHNESGAWFLRTSLWPAPQHGFWGWGSLPSCQLSQLSPYSLNRTLLKPVSSFCCPFNSPLNCPLLFLPLSKRPRLNLIISFKDLFFSPKIQSHSKALGLRTSTYEFRGDIVQEMGGAGKELWLAVPLDPRGERRTESQGKKEI